MQFDSENDRAYFEKDENTGINERLALKYPLDWQYVAIPALCLHLKQRRIELEKERLEGRPDYKAQQIVEIIDADAYSRRPDLYA